MWCGQVAESTAVVLVLQALPPLWADFVCGLPWRSSGPHVLRDHVWRKKGKTLFSPQGEEISGKLSPQLEYPLGIAKPAADNRVGILNTPSRSPAQGARLLLRT